MRRALIVLKIAGIAFLLAAMESVKRGKTILAVSRTVERNQNSPLVATEFVMQEKIITIAPGNADGILSYATMMGNVWQNMRILSVALMIARKHLILV